MQDMRFVSQTPVTPLTRLGNLRQSVHGPVRSRNRELEDGERAAAGHDEPLIMLDSMTQVDEHETARMSLKIGQERIDENDLLLSM